MVMLLQLPVAYLLDRRSKVVALAVGAGLFAASSTTLLVTDSFLGILMAFAGFFTLAETTVEIAGASLAAKNLAPAERSGTYLALFGCCFGVGYGTSPIVAGLLLDSRLPHNVILPGQLAMDGDTGDRRAPGARQAKKASMRSGRRRSDRFSRTRNTKMATSSREPFSCNTRTALCMRLARAPRR